MAFQVAGFVEDAKGRGFSADEIFAEVTKRHPRVGAFIAAARKQGYEPEYIVGELGKWPSEVQAKTGSRAGPPNLKELIRLTSTAHKASLEEERQRDERMFRYGLPLTRAMKTGTELAAGISSMGLISPASRALAPLGAWARPVAEAAWGGAAGTVSAIARGERRPAKIAKEAGITGLITGIVPAAFRGPLFREAAAGLRPLVKPVTEAIRPVFRPYAAAGARFAERLPTVSRASIIAGRSAARLFGAETPGKVADLEARNLRLEAREHLARMRVGEQERGAKLALQIEAEQPQIEVAAQAAGKAKIEADALLQRSFDEPAAGMMQVYANARGAGRESYKAAAKDERMATTALRRAKGALAVARTALGGASRLLSREAQIARHNLAVARKDLAATEGAAARVLARFAAIGGRRPALKPLDALRTAEDILAEQTESIAAEVSRRKYPPFGQVLQQEQRFQLGLGPPAAEIQAGKAPVIRATERAGDRAARTLQRVSELRGRAESAAAGTQAKVEASTLAEAERVATDMIAVARRSVKDATLALLRTAEPGPQRQLARVLAAEQAVADNAARLGRAKADLGAFAWASTPSKAAKAFPDSAKAAAEAAKVSGLARVLGDARTKGWSQESLDAIQAIRNRVVTGDTDLGREISDLFILSPQTMERWRGVHLRRVVPFFRPDMYDAMVGWLEANGPANLGELEKQVLNARRTQGLGSSLIGIPGAIFRRRKVPTATLPKEYGTELVSFLDRVAAGQGLAGQAVERAKGLRALARDLSISPEDWAKLPAREQGKWIQIEDARGMGELANRYMKAPVVRILKEWSTPSTTTQQVMAQWKALKVPWSLAASTHNLITDYISMAIEYGMGPLSSGNQITALAELAGNKGLWLEHSGAYPLAPGTWANAEVRRDIGKLRGVGTVAEAWRRINKYSPVRAYQISEIWKKWMAARWEITNLGVEPREAMKHAEFVFLNYSDVPSVIEKARRTPFGFPFGTWPFLMITRVIPHWVTQHTGKLYALYKTPELLTNLSDKQERIEIERAVMPRYHNPEMMIRLHWTDADGAGLWIDLSRLMPFSEIASSAITGAAEATGTMRRRGLAGTGEALYQTISGVFGPGLAAPAQVSAMVAGREPRGLKRLQDPSVIGRARALGGYVGNLVAPGIVADFVRAWTAEGPSIERPERRGRLLQAIRAAGFPIVRVKPDDEWVRAIDQTGRDLSSAERYRMTAKGKLTTRYWEGEVKRLSGKMDYLLRMSPPATEPLPSDKVRQFEESLSE